MAMVKGSGRKVKEVYKALPEGGSSQRSRGRDFPDAAPQIPINPRLNSSATVPVQAQQPRPFEKLMRSRFYRRRQRITPRDAEASVTTFCRKEMGGSNGSGNGNGVEEKGAGVESISWPSKGSS